MQKKLIALAVAGLASAGAFAQSNVTIYGVADASFESVKADSAAGDGTNTGSRSRMNTNSSLIGFKGSEDLGNGLKALFQFESTVNLVNQQGATSGNTVSGSAATNGQNSNNNGLLGTKRDSFVALSGNFGTVLGGYVSTPYRSIVTGFDVVPGSAGAGNSNGVFGKALGGVNLVFRTNAIAYASPSFNGFSGVIAYVPNATKSTENNLNTVTDNNGKAIANGDALNSANPYGWNLALNYANGGLKLAYSYLKLNDLGVGDLAAYDKAANKIAHTSGEDHKAHLLAASYDFGQGTTVVAMYQHYKGTVDVQAYHNTIGKSVGSGSGDVNRNSYFLGLKHVLGANEFAVSYQHAGKTGGDLLDNSNTDANQWTLRYGYNFSKRTQVYALYTRIDNKDGANFNFGGESGVNYTSTVAAGANAQVYGVGLRHSF